MCLNIALLSQPICLRRKISPHDVCLIILNAPRPNNYHITDAEPHPSLHLSWNAPHASFSVLRSNSDPAPSEHLFNCSEDFVLILSRQSHLTWLFFNQLNTSLILHVQALSSSQVTVRPYKLRVRANLLVCFGTRKKSGKGQR